MKSETFKLFDLSVSYHGILDFLSSIFTINNAFDADEIVGFFNVLQPRILDTG